MSQSLPQVVGTVYLRPRAGDGRLPYGIAADPVTHRVYTANSATGNVTVLDGATNTVPAVYSLGSAMTQPSGIAVNSATKRLYVANGLGGSMYVLSSVNGAVIAQVNPFGLVMSNVAIGVAVNPETNRIYLPFSSGEALSVVDGATNSVITIVTVGKWPVTAAVDPGLNRIFVANQSGRSVSVIDGASNQVVDTIALTGNPYGLAVDAQAHLLYVADMTGNQLVVINGTTGVVQSTFPLGGSPRELAFDAGSRHLFVTLPADNSVIDFNPAGPVTKQITVPGGPLSVTVDPVSRMVYTGQPNSSTLAVIQGATDQLELVLKIGSQPTAAAANPVTGRAYSVDDLGNLLDVIDGRAGTLLTTVQVGNGAGAVAVNSATNRIYTGNFGSVSVVDGATNQVVTAIPLEKDAVASAIAVNEATNRIYTSNSSTSDVSVLDGGSNQQIAQIDILYNGAQTSPLGIAVNPVTNRIYVAQYFGPGVAVIDGATNQVITTITLTQLEPMWVAVDPQTNLIYVTTYFSTTVVIDGSTNQVVATASPMGSDGAAVNHGLTRLYTGDYFHNALDVLDTTNNSILGSVGVGAGPFAVAVDTRSNRIFTANLNDGTVTILQDSAAQGSALPAPSGSTGAAVEVMCFGFHNPFSVNGPFGSIELWVSGSDVVGLMQMTLLFGLPSTTYLALSGTCSGNDPHICRLQGKGYMTQFGQKPVKAELGMTLNLTSDWKAGTLVFTQGVPGVTGGLPVVRVACKN